MKLVYPDITTLFDMENGMINTLVIENQAFLYTFLSGIQNEIDGNAGKFILSERDTLIDMSKYAEVISCFVPFEINRKPLLTKINTALEQDAMSASHYEKTTELLSVIERFLADLSLDFPCDIVFPKINISAVIKCAGAELRDEYGSIAEKVVDYMELVTEFEQRKLFVLVNMRSFVPDSEMEFFAQTVISHGYQILMVENQEYPRLANEKRLIIDLDLCEIS